MNKTHRWFLPLIFGLALCADVLSAGLDASLDRTRVVEGETLVLTLSAPGDTWGAPDLSPLAADFEVTNQGQSTRMSIVNGHTSSTREWQLLLAPRRTGTLSIPALKLGTLSSEALTLDVLPAAQAAEVGETLPVMLEVEVDQASPYVQGQVVYRVRVLTRANVHQGSLSDPVAEGTIIERLGEDKRYEAYRNGQRYQVIERGYALFPQHSGSLKVQAPVLTGEIPEQRRGGQGRRGSMFGGALSQDFERFFGRDPFEDMGTLFQRTRPVRVSGRELTLDVRPQPADAASPWLPTESLQLAETWSPDLSELRVGEPVTRTIAITAQGLTDAQLPDLELPVPDGVKVYPDKARNETRPDGDDVVSVKEVKLALVPSAEGELTLPEVRLAWWDTQTDRERIAALPARVVQVLPARAGAQVSPAEPAPVPTPAEVEKPRVEQPPAAGGSGPQAELVPEGLPASVGRWIPERYWPWIAAGLALAWIATLVLWLRERRRSSGAGPVRAQPVATPKVSPSAARARIKSACAGNDPKSAREALLAWASAVWPEAAPRRLDELGLRLDASAGDVLRELDRRLYAADDANWDGTSAWRGLAPALDRAAGEVTESGGKEAALPPLYPQQS